MDYSILMSVYYKETPDNLRTAMQSIITQTIPSDDFILVCDGPLTAELEAVIEEMVQKNADLIHVIRLKKNSGLGNALNIGLKYCKHDLVARMDSDDISRPNRCEQQLKVFSSQPSISICSGIIEEFSTSIDYIESRRVLPETNDEIIKFAKKRNPFNHPCVMYKKESVEKAGGYIDFYLLEDYYLWIRMLQNGSEGYNLQEPLLWMRAGSEMYKRRSGWKYIISQRKLFAIMRDSGFITQSQYILSTILRYGSSLAPNRLRKTLYACFLRKK